MVLAYFTNTLWVLAIHTFWAFDQSILRSFDWYFLSVWIFDWYSTSIRLIFFECLVDTFWVLDRHFLSVHFNQWSLSTRVSIRSFNSSSKLRFGHHTYNLTISSHSANPGPSALSFHSVLRNRRSKFGPNTKFLTPASKHSEWLYTQKKKSLFRHLSEKPLQKGHSRSLSSRPQY